MRKVERHVKLAHTIFEPSGDGPHPTLFALHGRGANAMDLLGLAPYLCGGRFLMICPQGPVEMPIGPGSVGHAWFPTTTGGARDLPALRAADEQVKAFMDDALARYPVDPRKVVVLGFSQGGAMAHGLMLENPQRFAAAVVLSSWLSQELVDLFARSNAPSYPPVLVQHGLRDELVSVDRARDSIEILRNLRVPVTYREYDMGHEITARSLADLSAWLEEKIFSPIIVPG